MKSLARRQGGAVETWRGFRAAVRLGWEVSSNWTSPFLFVVYSVLRPVSAALILVVMYRVISGNAASVYLAFLVTGTAFWGFVQNGLAEFANAIVEDRSHTRTLKYVYIAPQHFYVYLLGRGTAQLGSSLGAVVIVLTLATLALHLPIDPLRVNYAMLIAACLLAFAALAFMAMAFSILLLAARDAHGYGEIVAGVLYLGSGAIFPISVLPAPLAALASLSPLVYWMELIRRSLLTGQVYRMFPALTDGEVFLRLGVSAAVVVGLSHLVFRWGERNARAGGLIDMETNW